MALVSSFLSASVLLEYNLNFAPANFSVVAPAIPAFFFKISNG